MRLYTHYGCYYLYYSLFDLSPLPVGARAVLYQTLCRLSRISVEKQRLFRGFYVSLPAQFYNINVQ